MVAYQIFGMSFCVSAQGQIDDNNAQSNDNQEYTVHVELHCVEYSGSRKCIGDERKMPILNTPVLFDLFFY